jgi:hypothetical protein
LNPTGYSQVLDELVSGAVTKTYTYGLQRISENQFSGSTWTPTFYGYDEIQADVLPDTGSCGTNNTHIDDPAGNNGAETYCGAQKLRPPKIPPCNVVTSRLGS